jgi:hypothetical protein
MKSENTREEDKSANIPEAAPTDTPAPPTANKKKNNITKITQKRKPAKKRPIKRNHVSTISLYFSFIFSYSEFRCFLDDFDFDFYFDYYF